MPALAQSQRREVSAATQARLLDTYRDINLDHEWWDCVYGDWREKLVALGIVNPDMQFSGFCSQGDGASFTGYLDTALFLAQHPEIGCKAARALAARELLPGRLIRCSNHYSHEGTVALELELLNVEDMGGDPVTQAVLDVAYQAIDTGFANLEHAILEQCRDYMQQLYADLELVYEHLTSDEAVWDTITANDLDQDEEADDEDDED